MLVELLQILSEGINVSIFLQNMRSELVSA